MEPFFGCSRFEWDGNVLTLVTYPVTPGIVGYEPKCLPVMLMTQYNSPTSDSLWKRHVLFKLLAEIDASRVDLQNIVLGIINTGNLPVAIKCTH
jgi:hypothetical protein